MSATENSLANLVGLAARYVDQSGRVIETSAASQRAILSALGFDIHSAKSADAELAAMEREARAPLPSIIVTVADAPTLLHPDLTNTERKWTLQLEDGSTLQGRFSGRLLKLPALPAGYHRLSYGDAQLTSMIFSAPDRCYAPSALSAEKRAFGIAAQVYSLRRDGDMGIGDLGHVFDLAQGCGALGADLLGLSPLHALFPSDRTKVSPYSPSTRFFIDPIYIDPAAIPGSRGPEGSDSSHHRRLVDFASVWTSKATILRDFWSVHHAAIAEDAIFHDYVLEQGERLQAHATFDALSAHFAAQGLSYSGAWPQAFRSSANPEVAAFRRDHQEDILFWTWLQYIADSQLGAASVQARQTGMGIGLYRDLAVGADLFGSEVWSEPDAWCSDLSVGAPPDPLGPKGQDWGLPPLNPRRLGRNGLATFRALVAANMRHAGAVRIDHAFQLQRLFVIPRGRPASEGAYLAYPFEAMLAVLRIESHRARCAVIAEDLGNGPQGFSSRIMNDGIFSYRILSFERTRDGGFVRPQDYPPVSLASINTHDLPTFAGWWRGLDIDLRECFGVYNLGEWTREKLSRKAERGALLDALSQEGLTEATDVPEKTARCATIQYLARTRSQLAIVNLEDVGGELNQPNLPGLADGYPNWRRRLNQTIDQMTAPYGDLSKTAAVMAREGRGTLHPHPVAMQLPRATYRLQLNRAFTFENAIEVVPKLKALGISHVYVSPITTATPGSTHGYDVTDPTKINPELGGRDGFDRFVAKVQSAGLGLIVDIVPNHMAAGPDNPWWRSVLEVGERSPYAGFFDIDWRRHAHGKLVLPILAKPRGVMLKAGEIELCYDEDRDVFFFSAGQQIPIDPLHSAGIRERCRRLAGPGQPIAEGLQKLMEADPDFISDLFNQQAWHAVYWRSGRPDINYRRFFEIDALAGLRVEASEVFESSHQLIFDLVRQGAIQGLRIDHVDGLSDPKRYLERVQDRVGPGFYVVVEKILGADETLPEWPIAGTTGYDGLRLLDGVFLDPNQDREITAVYESAVGGFEPPEQALATIKADLAETSFAPELGKLVSLALAASSEMHGCNDLSADAWRRLLRDFISALPVYRTYLDQGPIGEADRVMIEQTMKAMDQDGSQDVYAMACLRQLLLNDGERPQAAGEFRTRLQQLSGPIMAKAQEDTLFYRDNRLVAQNEVGNELAHATVTLAGFHKSNVSRCRKHPGTMIATATHDTKRGEDARARLIALAQHPEEMRSLWLAWTAASGRLQCHDVHANDHYMVLQNALAAWPLAIDEFGGENGRDEFSGRIREFLPKALREAKLRSNWTAPNIAYEKRVQDCAVAVITDREFLRETKSIRDAVNMRGAWVALARTVLKATIPGVPDFYQGSEGWDYSLVDPDNRRPAAFNIPSGTQGPLDDLMQTWFDGRVKCELTRRLLMLRRQDPDLFAFGDYEPLGATAEAPWVLFRRIHDDEVVTVAVLRHFARDWRGPLLPAEAYDGLATSLDLRDYRSLILENSSADGTAASWQELCGGMPFTIMRSAT